MNLPNLEAVVHFRRHGWWIARGLVPTTEIAELARHAQSILDGSLPGLAKLIGRDPAGMTRDELAAAAARLHMLHRRLPLHERWLLHPRICDAMAILIGPDVLALQSMLFIKPPGSAGQDWHQDTFFIPTQPQTLCGAWLAIDHVDDENGGLWVAEGSHVEPIRPPLNTSELAEWGERHIPDLPAADGIKPDGTYENHLSEIASRYSHRLGTVAPGDCIFFHGALLHRSGPNRSRDRLRRAFVGHYCNARSFVGWGARIPRQNVHHAPKVDPATGMTNESHILARGDSHLPFAQPTFGSPCAATYPAAERRCTSWDAGQEAIS